MVLIRDPAEQPLLSGETFGTLHFNGLPIVFDKPETQGGVQQLYFIDRSLFNPRHRIPRGQGGRRRTWSYPRFAPLRTGPAIWPDGSEAPTGILMLGCEYIGLESKAYGRFKRRQMQRRSRARRISARHCSPALKAML